MQGDNSRIDLEDPFPKRTGTKPLGLEPLNLEIDPASLGTNGNNNPPFPGTEISCQGGRPVRMGENPETVTIFDQGKNILDKRFEFPEDPHMGQPCIDGLLQSMAEMFEIFALFQQT